MKTNAFRHELNKWKFSLDQSSYGLTGGWAATRYDDSSWTEVSSYTSWETYEDAMRDYEGKAWFRTKFTPTKVAGVRFILHFEGVGGVAQVYINGKYAGGTENRYLPFELDITNFVRKQRPTEQYAESVIAVCVDNSFRGKQHLTGGGRVEWVLYGGLTHRVWVEERPASNISHVRVDAAADGSLKVTATVEGRNHVEPFTAEVRMEVEGLTSEPVCKPVECPISTPAGPGVQKVCFELKFDDVKLWSPETPNLYTVRVALYKDNELRSAVEERFGFRTIETRGTHILLNGKELLVKGANRYDEYAPYGICPPIELIREDFQAMKDVGINLIRTHYPQDAIHYELADEMGLMYMIEVPLNWWAPKDTDYIDDHLQLLSEAVDCLDRTFYWHCNHPSWTFWSVGNECKHNHPVCNQAFHMLAARMRRLDCRRLITYAAHKPFLNSQEMDFCDVLSMNYYSGILSENEEQFPEQMDKVLEEKFKTALRLYPDKPHMMTEFGYVCVRGVRNSTKEGRYAEDFGGTFLRADCKALLKNPNMRGLVIWCWADYRHRRGFVPSKTNMGIQATYGPWGLVTMDRKPKAPIVEAMKEVFEGFTVSE